MAPTSGAVQAGARLRSLLVGEERYRRLWVDQAQRSGGSPNVDAVSRVIMNHRWAAYDDPAESSRQIKDRARRALAGQVLTFETLRWFTEAFGMSSEHCAALEAELALIEAGAPEPQSALQVLSLHELHYVGADRLPTHHRTLVTVRALRDQIDRHVLVFDTDEIMVNSPHGAFGPTVPSRRPGYWQCPLIFKTPLMKGEVKTIELDFIFNYTAPPPPEIRKMASKTSVYSLSLTVHFDAAAPPREVQLCRWDDPDTDFVKSRALARLDGDAVAHHFEPELRDEVVGFVWSW